jgi:triosephosphate isomerase
MPRKKLMAANWKMYKNPDQTRAFFRDFLPLVAGHTRDEIVVCPPYIDLYFAIEDTKGSNVAIGAQDLYWEKRAPTPAKSVPPCCSTSDALMSLSATPSAASTSEKPMTS